MATASASPLPVTWSLHVAFECLPAWRPRLRPGPAARASGRQAGQPARQLTNTKTNTQQLGEPQSKQASGEPKPAQHRATNDGQRSNISAANAPAERAANEASFESGRSNPTSSCCRQPESPLRWERPMDRRLLSWQACPRLAPPPGDRICACLHIPDTSAFACLHTCAPRYWPAWQMLWQSAYLCACPLNSSATVTGFCACPSSLTPVDPLR